MDFSVFALGWLLFFTPAVLLVVAAVSFIVGLGSRFAADPKPEPRSLFIFSVWCLALVPLSVIGLGFIVLPLTPEGYLVTVGMLVWPAVNLTAALLATRFLRA